jgi:hypothetical protein
LADFDGAQDFGPFPDRPFSGHHHASNDFSHSFSMGYDKASASGRSVITDDLSSLCHAVDGA